ncbi:molecular chaperone [Providencia burhodogranariea]|uniref:Type 1 fimbrial chaperone protein n=1 Tax=Providencia burhodogranariea DSM 19968 TaxID=1141662 RepID=K8W863_9GAMM|nr:molecular chaperone [Providencia burhodogranariea]EKT56046.1 type 1 fimbrial chaperone protein [Providencia burhodogranariea DSM 19968]
MFKKTTFALTILLACQTVYADGISLGATRLIYPTDKNQISLKIYNTDKTGNYLIQSWISDENDNKVSDFLITPPLFVIKSNTDNLLNIVYSSDKNNLPTDKEKLYYLNSKVIPSLSEEEQKIDNALLISTTTKIKLFVRPSGIKESSFESYEKLKCSYENNKVKIENPTPFYMNLVSLTMNGKEISKAETIAPNTSVYLNTNEKNNGLTFNFINDYGVQIKNKQCKL